MPKKVLSLGAIAMDIVLNSMDLPKDDGFGFIEHENILPGGSASNVSVAAASLGLDVYQTGMIGDDVYGNEFRRTLVIDGVDDSLVVTKPNGTTLHTYIITAPGGKHCIFANIGDTACSMKINELPKSAEDMMADMDIFYNDMFSGEVALELANVANKTNKPVVYNMQCLPDFMENCGTSKQQIKQMLSLCNIFVTGKDGIKAVSGKEDIIEGIKFIQNKYHMSDGVICTAGSEGGYWYDGKDIYHADSVEVEVIDTTGAGDCFIGGLLKGYYDCEMDKSRALMFANATAAIKCTLPGPRSHASYDDVLALINR